MRAWAYKWLWLPLSSWVYHRGWRRCGNACGWEWPYGFVPECGCPAHNPTDE